ncbi:MULTISPECIES: hypothetical protein [unclassified Mesorhizobium]|uniref:hypothetical protein n=1 Tax=unclassified Mesorhizobium TaxID=325217 RepID=UPI0003CEAC10|nr:hypothetical protein [Mesorhizobium sp. LNJC391B00]ESY30038.1 hypothetical protein X749_14435 [Mesorhizobium sp. LNJC391B00]
MDITALIGPAVVAAVVSGAISLVSATLAARSARTMHTERLAADAALAEKRYLYERALADWKRKTDIAETVLGGFYRARSIFQAARQPFARSGEGTTRERGEDETDDAAAYKNAIYAPLERLTKELPFLSELNAQRYRFAALFGSDGDAAFSHLVTGYNRVQHATYALLNDRKPLNSERQEKYEVVIGWDEPDKDEISKNIDSAVATIERLCKPVLSSQP